MKIIRNILVTIVGIAFVIGLAIFGTQIYFKKKHDIDLFATIANFKTMSKEVDESALFPDVYTDEDKETTMSTANASINNLISKDAESGKYSINLTGISGMNSDLKFTDKQLAFFAQLMVESQMNGQLKLSESTTLNFCVRQIKISDVKDDGSATLNVVVKFDLTSVKEGMTSFPMNFIKKYVPDSLYVSSTVGVEKDATDNFKYTITSKSLTFNNLTSEETTNTFKTLDYFLKVGSAESLNKQVGETVMNVLVGVKDDDTKKGLAVALDPLADGYRFEATDGVGQFVITKKTGE